MMETLLDSEPLVRFGFFAGTLAVMMTWELVAPRRRPALSRWSRWPGNLGIVAVDTLLLRLLMPTALVGVALLWQERGLGLLNQLDLPDWAALALSVLALDLAMYLQHVLFHAIPALWRLHRMHHADADFDVTTGVRFHPLEILVSTGVKALVVLALGAPAAAVLIFEVLLNATSMFNHGNVRMPAGLDRVLRRLVVTPDMHRVHHSTTPRETNSNFGFNLPWWDRLLGTYRAQPAAGHERMSIGLDRFRLARDQRLDRLLLQPFAGATGDYPITRRNGSDRSDP